MSGQSFPFESASLGLAVAEILVLLAIAAASGWLLSRALLRRSIEHLEATLEEQKFELAHYRTLNKQNLDQPIAMNATKTVYPTTSPDHAPDDLKVIEGIGPKIEEILNRQGIHTYEQLAETPLMRLSAILKQAGPRFQIQDPTTWTRQVEFAKDRKWEELEQFKSELRIGRLAH